MLSKNNIIYSCQLAGFIFVFLLFETGWSQIDTLETVDLDSSYMNIDNDTTVTTFWPNVIYSAIFPGLGQVQQERPAKAVVFYGLAASFFYNAAYNYYWYDRTDNNKYFTRFRKFSIFYGQIYLFNLIDVVKTHLTGKDLLWQGGMYSDKPLKSPWGAVARSAMLPGWGQIYNEQYIKAIVTFGLFADFTRKAIVSNLRYMDTDKKSQLERRTVNTWYVGLVYMLNMVDAYVDAYLFKFDEVMQYTFTVVPIENTYGIKLSIEF